MAARAMKVTGDGAAGSASRFALCVGVAAYKSSPLRNTLNDARAVAAALRGIGFAVTLLENPGFDELPRGVERFTEALRPGGVSFFFFAGHGTQAEDGSNYLIPVEEVERDTQLRYKALSAQDVLDRLERGGCALNFVVLDACRSKPSRLERSTRSGQLTGLSRMEAPAGSVLAYACAAGKTALDGEAGSHGVYTKHLLSHLTRPNLDVDHMLRAVSLGVFEETGKAQDPYHTHNLKKRASSWWPARRSRRREQAAALAPRPPLRSPPRRLARRRLRAAPRPPQMSWRSCCLRHALAPSAASTQCGAQTRAAQTASRCRKTTALCWAAASRAAAAARRTTSVSASAATALAHTMARVTPASSSAGAAGAGPCALRRWGCAKARALIVRVARLQLDYAVHQGAHSASALPQPLMRRARAAG
jgi:hypothetical protein